MKSDVEMIIRNLYTITEVFCLYDFKIFLFKSGILLRKLSLILQYNLREIHGGEVMRTFNYYEIKNQKWDSDILVLIAAIYKETWKQEMYLKQCPKELEKLVGIAKVQSIEASFAIEGIVTTSSRIRQLVEEKIMPKNRDEQESAGYRDVLNIIHDSLDAIPITQNYILQLHKILYAI